MYATHMGYAVRSCFENMKCFIITRILSVFLPEGRQNGKFNSVHFLELQFLKAYSMAERNIFLIPHAFTEKEVDKNFH